MKSKIRLLIINFALILTFSHNAQAQTSDNLSYGIIVGYGQTEIVGENLSDSFEPTLKPRFGVNLEYSFSEGRNIILVLEPSYQRKSVHREDRITDEQLNFVGTSEYSINLDYIIVPVRLSYRKGENWQIMLDVGLYFSYLFQQKDILEGPEFRIGGTVHRTLEFDYRERYNPTDFGFSGGIGLGKELNSQVNMRFSLQTELGISNIQSSSAVWASGDLQTKAINLVLAVNYKRKK